MGEPLPVSVDTAHNDQGESAGWLSSILAQVLIQETVSNVNDRFKLAADAIDQEIEALLEEEEALNKAAEEEQFEVNEELARVTLLVTSFKDQVERYLSSY